MTRWISKSPEINIMTHENFKLTKPDALKIKVIKSIYPNQRVDDGKLFVCTFMTKHNLRAPHYLVRAFNESQARDIVKKLDGQRPWFCFELPKIYLGEMWEISEDEDEDE